MHKNLKMLLSILLIVGLVFIYHIPTIAAPKTDKNNNKGTIKLNEEDNLGKTAMILNIRIKKMFMSKLLI